jgi:threonyl-tRNA synthetase
MEQAHAQTKFTPSHTYNRYTHTDAHTYKRTHRDLPIRMAELGTVYRYERSGTLSGLFRVRGFTQDDAHIFCLPEQVRDHARFARASVMGVLLGIWACAYMLYTYACARVTF